MRFTELTKADLSKINGGTQLMDATKTLLKKYVVQIYKK